MIVFVTWVTQLIRTGVQLTLAALVAYLVRQGVVPSDTDPSGLITAVSGFLGLVAVGLLMLVERRWPWTGIVFGIPKTPEYIASAEASSSSSTDRFDRY